MDISRKFAELSRLGAGDFIHLSSSLEDHLKKTRNLLSDWGASNVLQDAGLFHAAYGTAGFEAAMVDTSQREKIAQIIGKSAEQIVYTYCACDRAFVWPLIDGSSSINFRDRFKEETGLLEGQELKDFCELTIANETQIAMENEDFARKHGQFFCEFVSRMGENLSRKARLAARKVFTGADVINKHT